MNEYDVQSIDMNPTVSEFYHDVDDEYKIGALDTSFLGELTLAVWEKLKANFELYYDTREIGGESEYDFFTMLQSTLNRNADTYERHLKVYNDDIANPILGRTEVVTYDTTDSRRGTTGNVINYGGITTRTEDGQELNHHVEVPANLTDYDVDKTRDRTEFIERTTTDENSGIDTQTTANNETRGMTGTVTTELSDLGVRPNYESLNGFLENNKTYIQFFIETFESCFAPRYKRVFF